MRLYTYVFARCQLETTFLSFGIATGRLLERLMICSSVLFQPIIIEIIESILTKMADR